MSAARSVHLEPTHRAASRTAGAGLRMFRTEFRRSLCLWLFPFMVAALAWTVHDGLPAGIWLWTETVWSVQYSLILFGPLVGGIAVWAAGRERRRGMGDLLLTTPRPAVARDLAVWAATAAWCCLAYATVAVAFLLLTSLNATWGSPEFGPVLVGLIAIVAHSALGYAIGSYLPSRFVAPLFAISMYWIQGITLLGLGSRFRNLSPLGSDIASTVFYDETPDVFAPQTLWLLGLAGVALVAVALKRERSMRYWAVLAVAAAVAVIGAVVLARVPTETVDARGTPVPYEPVCERGAIEVCVHPAYETALLKTNRVVNDIAEPLVGIPGAPTYAEQRGDAYPSRLRADGTLLFDIRGAFTRSNVNDGFTFEEYMEAELPFALVADPSGYIEEDFEAYNSGESCSKPGGHTGEAQHVVADWLRWQTGIYSSMESETFMDSSRLVCPESEAAVKRFDALAPAERRAWLEKNYADLRAGKLTLKDLP